MTGSLRPNPSTGNLSGEVFALALAFDAVPYGVLLADDEGRIRFANEGVARTFGYARDELVGASIDLLIQPRDDSAGGTPPGSGGGSERDGWPHTSDREVLGTTRDGEAIPLDVSFNRVEMRDGFVTVVSLVDVSARVRLERELLDARRLESLGRLAGLVVHNFNNVLVAVSGFAELARARATGSVAVDLDGVIDAARSGEEIVEGLLRFSRAEGTPGTPRYLSGEVGEAERLLRVIFPTEAEIALELPTPGPRVLADPTALQQVVVNLATDKAQAMRVGARLFIRVDEVCAPDDLPGAPPSVPPGRYARLTVADTLGDEERGGASQALGSPTAAGLPTRAWGPGLSLVQRIIQDLGGVAWLEDEPGWGACAHCLIPLLEGAGVADEAQPSDEPPRGRSELVLLVDDEPALANVGQRRLTALGYRVQSAGDGSAALAFLEDPGGEQVDLVLTDYAMPLMNGIELARRIRTLRKDLPVVLMTGYVEDSIPESLADAGVAVLLEKPMSLLDLATVVRRTIDAAAVAR